MKLEVALVVAAVGVLERGALAQSQALLVSHYTSPGFVEQLDGAGNQIAVNGGGPGQSYVGMAVNAAGEWVTTRRGSNGVERFSSTGVSLGGFATPEITGSASDVSIFADGTLTVCDLGGGGGVRLYSPTGTYLTSFPAGAQAWASTVDGLDRLWTIDLTNNPAPPSTIKTFDRAGNLLQTFQVNYQAGDIVVAPDGTLWVSDLAGRAVHLSSTGVELSNFSTGLGSNCYGIALMLDGSLWLAGYSLSQLGHFSATGTPIGPVITSTLTGAVLLSTHEQCGIVNTYCTAGTSTNGCRALISATGTPSISSSTGCVVSVQNLEGQKQALTFYGISGALALPWATGSTSYLCVKPPTQRIGVVNSGGTLSQCNGSLSFDLNAWLASHPAALGQSLPLGQGLWLQTWYRDPAQPKTTSLSDALFLRMCP